MTHIEQRHDTAANWTSANPILLVGEVGWETNTRKSKLGDGVTHWNDLSYSAAGISATKADVGLDQVDNTSDLDKPLSTATALAIAGKASLASPTFTGDPKAPTPTTSDNDTSIATTAFVHAAITAALAAVALTEHPIGSLEFNVTNTNPSTYLGGTWVAWGSGRVPVGVDAAQTEFDTAEETGGEKTHVLTTGELPVHHHAIGGSTGGQSVTHHHVAQGNVRYVDNTAVGGSRRRIVAVTESPASTSNAIAAMNMTTTDASADHTHTLPANTGDTGSATAHNNLPPYITCYMFKRTA